MDVARNNSPGLPEPALAVLRDILANH